MSGLHYTTSDGIHYSRRLHGRERMSACNISYGEGYGQIICICHTLFRRSLSREELAPSVKAAWIRFRFAVPWIAIRTSKLEESEPNSYIYTYETSSTQNVLDNWAEETIKWRPEVVHFSQWEKLLKRTYWGPNDKRFSLELHMGRGDSEMDWSIMFTCPHFLTDGRGLFPVVCEFLQFLREEMETGPSNPFKSLTWGAEVVRLPPAVVEVIPDIDDGVGPSNIPDPETHFVRTVPECSEPSGIETIHELIILSQEQTQTFHSLCRKHRCSVTSAINSALILADIETIVTAAHDIGNSEFERVRKSFEEAEVFPVMVNVADTRSLVSPHYTRLLSPGGMGNIINNIFTSYHDMASIRRCILVGSDASTKKNFAQKTFWDGLVPNTRSLLKQGSKVNRRTFVAAQHMIEDMVKEIDGFQATIPGVMLSSIGNLDAIPAYFQFRPEIISPSSPFCVRSFSLGIRTVQTPAIVVNTWAYDGRVCVNLQGSARFYKEKVWGIFCAAVKDALEQMVMAKTSL